MKDLTIYLAGPIKGLDPEEILGWCLQFNKNYSSSLDFRWPQQNAPGQSNNAGRALLASIATDERLDILNSDATIAYIDRNIVSLDAVIAIMYAYLSGRTVVIVKEKPGHRLSKIVECHCHAVCSNLEDAINFIIQRHNRCSISQIINRDGSTADWDPKQILKTIQVAIGTSFDTSMLDISLRQLEARYLAEAAIMKIEDDIQSGNLQADYLEMESIQDIIEKILIINTPRDEVRNLAKEYIVNRKLREDKWRKLFNDRDLHDFATGVFHQLHGPVGNIGRSINELSKLLDSQDFNGLKHELADLRANFNYLMGYLKFCRERL